MTTKLFDRAMLAVCLTAVLLAAGYGLFYAAGFRINDTRSVAKGVYRISDESIRRGSYITFCPPDTEVFRMARRRGYIRSGFCPKNYSGLMKFVAGIPGDNYRFTDEGLLINGRLLGGTRPLLQDGVGQPLPVFKGEGRLKDDEYILVGNAVANSFDARYYGIVRREYIRDVVKPIWIEE